MSQGDPTPRLYDRKAGTPLSYSASPAVLRGKSHIDTWPTELLQECFELAFDGLLLRHSIVYHDDDVADIALQQQAYALAHSVSSTCKSFRAVMMPILYSQVHIIPYPRRTPQAQDTLVPVQFVRTMNTSPALREHVRCLDISIQDFARISPAPGREGFAFTRLGKVSLTLTHDWSAREWEECCTNLRNLPVLSELHVGLSRLKEYKDDFRPFYRILGQLPLLSKLTLEGVSTDRSGYDALDWSIEGTEYKLEEKEALSQDEKGSASFTQLDLLYCSNSSPTGFGEVISLPSALETLTIDRVGMSGYDIREQIHMGCVSFVWTFDQIRKQLLPQRHTLQELRIGLIGPDQEGLLLFDLHDFDRLRTLQLCYVGLPAPDNARDLWLTPSLQRLAIEYSTLDLQCGLNWHVEKRDVEWLTGFAQLAAERRGLGISGLRTIEIICDMSVNEEFPMSGSARRDIEANCAEAKRAVEACGFEFVWCKEM